MKSARVHAFVIGLVVIMVVAITLYVIEVSGLKSPFLRILIPAAFVGLVAFLIVRYYFIRYAIGKINPILRTIHSYTISKKALRDKVDRGDVIGDLNQDVRNWADNQSSEIKKLKQLEKYRKDFLGNVSHELKTPIFNIQGYILTLLEGGIEDASINKLYLKRAEKSTNRLISIVQDLDSIARLESGEFKLRMEAFNLVKVVEEVIEYQEMQAKQKDIRIGFDGNYNKPIKVKADKKRIFEVLDNLISNSIKYGKEGGKTTIGFEDNGDHIMVDITDNGIGIVEQDLPRIYERFFRVDKSRSRESGGTGLGLSIVKHTIQAHNQSITVRSKESNGTTFVFSLEKAE